MTYVNGMEGVVWMIDGADHSADVARTLAYVAGNGGDGIVSPADLKVTVSNSQLHMAPGAFVTRNRSANARSQSYVGRAIAPSDIDMGPNTSGVAQAYMLGIIIRDPQFSPNQNLYADDDPRRINGPYAFPELFPCPANAKRWSDLGRSETGLAVCRVNQPAGAVGVIPEYVTDLRKMASVNNFTDLLSESAPYPRLLSKSDTQWYNWPGRNPSWEIPEWANWVSVKVDLGGIGIADAATDGELRCRLNYPNGFLVSSPKRIDEDPGVSGGGRRGGYFVTCSGWLPEAAKGGQLTVNVEGHIAAGSPGQIGTNEGSDLAWTVVFSERVV